MTLHTLLHSLLSDSLPTIANTTLSVHAATPTPSPFGTIYHAHTTCTNPALTTYYYNANIALPNTVLLPHHTCNINLGGDTIPIIAIHKAMSKADAEPHNTTHLSK